MPPLCKFCGYYQPTGRRGGICTLFNTPICGRQDVCCLAVPAFSASVLPVSTMLGMSELEALLTADDPTTTLLDPDIEDEMLNV